MPILEYPLAALCGIGDLQSDLIGLAKNFLISLFTAYSGLQDMRLQELFREMN